MFKYFTFGHDSKRRAISCSGDSPSFLIIIVWEEAAWPSGIPTHVHSGRHLNRGICNHVDAHDLLPWQLLAPGGVNPPSQSLGKVPQGSGLGGSCDPAVERKERGGPEFWLRSLFLQREEEQSTPFEGRFDVGGRLDLCAVSGKCYPQSGGQLESVVGGGGGGGQWAGQSSRCFAVGVTDKGGGMAATPWAGLRGATWLRGKGRNVPGAESKRSWSLCGFSLCRPVSASGRQRKEGPVSLLEVLELTESPLMIDCIFFRVLFH